MYPEFFIQPMREELTRHGVQELRTADDVDTVLGSSSGTVMVVVNSVCGCAAGKARPGIAMALQHGVKPDVVATVFAGADVEATERARGYFTGYPPSSPAVRPAAWRQDHLYDGASPDRESGGAEHRRRFDGGIRHALRDRSRELTQRRPA